MCKQRKYKRENLTLQTNICNNKRTYFTRKEARDKAKRYSQYFGNNSRVYKCPVCGFYHITTKVKEANINSNEHKS